MDWTDIKLTVPARFSDTAEAIATGISGGGIYIEDYRDLESQVEAIAHVDLIEQDLLDKKRDEVIVHLYIAPDENVAEIADLMRDRLARAEVPYTMALEGVRQEDWENGWKQYYHAMDIGARLAVVPSWEQYDTDRAVITLDPGMAFGTGTHHTTQLCLEQLEENIKPGCSILDMGCGSGILSIGGILLGAANATAVDIDPVAVRTCQENAAVNGVHADRYRALSGDLVRDKKLREEIGSGYDIITANIVADIIIALAPTFDGFLKDDGVLITSGIIAERHQDVVEALAKEGFYPVETVERKGWVAITLKKAGKE